MNNAVVTIEHKAVDIFDPSRFQTIMDIARVMAQAALCPDALRGEYEGQGQNRRLKLFTSEQITGNCFMVVEQAANWGISPFAAAQCVSVVHGKLMWEGKLVAGVIEKNAGVRLNYEWTGDGEQMRVRVFGQYGDENAPREIAGSVSDWKTTGNNSPWTPKNYRRQLAYRGAREWSRLHAPGIMLGVITDDEALETGPARSEPPKSLNTGFVEKKLATPRKTLPKPTPEATEASQAPEEPGTTEDAGADEMDQREPMERARSAFAEALHDAPDWQSIRKAVDELDAAMKAANIPATAEEDHLIDVAAWGRFAEIHGEAIPYQDMIEDLRLFALFVAIVKNAESLKAVWNSVQVGDMYARLSVGGKAKAKGAVMAKLKELEPEA